MGGSLIVTERTLACSRETLAMAPCRSTPTELLLQLAQTFLSWFCFKSLISLAIKLNLKSVLEYMGEPNARPGYPALGCRLRFLLICTSSICRLEHRRLERSSLEEKSPGPVPSAKRGVDSAPSPNVLRGEFPASHPSAGSRCMVNVFLLPRKLRLL